MPRIGFHARITNPLTLGYYAYLACFDSWRKITDKVVAVDGGSSDGSIELLRRWVDDDPKLHVINNDISHWGRNFAWEQSTLNMQLGHEELDDCDWIIRTDADHVVNVSSVAELQSYFDTKFIDNLVVAFDVYYLWNGKYRKRGTPRNWVINNRLAKETGNRIGWGKDLNTNLLSDAPLRIVTEYTFTDPETGATKFALAGIPLEIGPVCSLEVYRYGHFFFTPEQAATKVKIWNKAVTNFTQIPCKGSLMVALDADIVGIRGFMSTDEILGVDHPDEVDRLIRQVYEPGMLGGARYVPGIDLIKTGLRFVARIKQWNRKIMRYWR